LALLELSPEVGGGGMVKWSFYETKRSNWPCKAWWFGLGPAAIMFGWELDSTSFACIPPIATSRHRGNDPVRVHHADAQMVPIENEQVRGSVKCQSHWLVYPH